MNDWTRWAAGAGLAIAIAGGARAARSLSASGAVAAAVLGTVAVGAGWSWGVLLVAYFVSSSALARLGRSERERRTAGRVDKTGARDAVQVAANGAVFGLCALAFAASHSVVWMLAGVGALAASAADTWATEIGTLARSSARSILTGRVVPTGTSGGVTVQGLMAGVAGAAFVGGIASAVGWERAAVNAIVAGGVIGMVVDSLLGASLQSRRWCPQCGTDTEQRVHQCGTPTEQRAGLHWLDNDGVNALSTIAGAVAAVLLWKTP